MEQYPLSKSIFEEERVKRYEEKRNVYMKTQYAIQQSFLVNISLLGKFPTTRYQGSKSKLSQWITEQISEFDFVTCLDAFGGTGVIAFHLKKLGKIVTYNDILKFNYYIGTALIENKNTVLTPSDIDWLLTRHSGIEYPGFIQTTFHDIYFTDLENEWLDQTITNIYQLKDKYKFALAFFALCQASIIKRPYNLFHRKNLYVRTSDVERSFGNKTTWDKPFSTWFSHFCMEANGAVFDNGQDNKVFNSDALDVPGNFDLVYIDTPYISNKGVATDYRDFYHFLEGLTIYQRWNTEIEYASKHRRLSRVSNDWNDKKAISQAFDKLFERYKDSILIVSYRSDGIPSEDELMSMLKKYKKNVKSEHFGQYKYVLSKNSASKEILVIGTD